VPDLENTVNEPTNEEIVLSSPPLVDVVAERFYGNPMNEFVNGVMMDVRAKFAVEFLKAYLAAPHAPVQLPRDAARYALDLADELMSEAAARGYLEPLPDGEAIPAELAKNLKLGARASIGQQVFGQEIAKEMAPRVAPVNGPLPPPRRNGGRR
jgi:hypothetical protein